MKKAKKIIIVFFCITFLISILILSPNAQSTNDNTIFNPGEITLTEVKSNQIGTRGLQFGDITGQEFYIKNMYTGQYLDVKDGIAANGTNVQQCKFNGSYAQKWYIHDYGDGTFGFLARTGATDVYNYALDVSSGSASDYANIHIWEINYTDSQKYKIYQTNYSSFVFLTTISNYSKAVVLNGPTCDEGGNVDQYTYQGHVNEMWILEPVQKNETLGIEYAMKNYNQYVTSYPNLSKMGGDCANFVSQCMLASGVHYDGNWKVYRKNNNYSTPTDRSQLDNTWELCQPNASPWVSAAEFGNYWKNKIGYEKYTVNYILEHSNETLSYQYLPGDVIQVADNFLGILGNSKHTMFITDFSISDYKSEISYQLTYHSNNTEKINLIDFCLKYKNAGENPFLVFYKIR